MIEDQTISTHPNAELLERLKKDLLEAYKVEENFWKQCNRQLWLHLGDKNTGCFHASTEKRKSMNKFAVLENEDGVPVYKEKEITATIERYFSKLFTPNICNLELMDKTVSKAIYPRITNEQNETLTRIPSSEGSRKLYFSSIMKKPQALMVSLRVSSRRIGQ